MCGKFSSNFFHEIDIMRKVKYKSERKSVKKYIEKSEIILIHDEITLFSKIC